MNTPLFEKYTDGLVPAIVQHATTGQVLMLGYMNEAAWQQTQQTKLVTFYSRSRQAIWVKGETSGNYLHLSSMATDCDQDALLVQALPAGPVCHTGDDNCFGTTGQTGYYFLSVLEQLIAERKQQMPGGSYTTSLFNRGIGKIAQKVGEEAVELVIEALGNDENLFTNEAADLVFHLLILLQAKGSSLSAIAARLSERHAVATGS